MEIRSLSPETLDEALALIEEIFLASVQPSYPEPVTFSEYLGQTPSSLKEEMEAGTLRFWGAYFEGRLMGAIALKGESFIRFFYVHGDFQGRGVGRGLMDALLAHAEHSIRVHAAPDAIPIYERMGFRPEGALMARGGVRYLPMRLPR